MNPIRAALGSSLVAVAVAGASAVAAAPASAAVQIACAGTESVSYRPGLTNRAQPVAVAFDVIFAPCISPTQPAIRSGRVSVAGPITGSCLDLLASTPLSETVRWNTGATSTLALITAGSYLPGTLTVVETGTVSAGVFSGSTVTGTVNLAGDLLDCGTPAGLTSLFGPYTLQIVL